ncbi:MAG TPA: glycosyltransferase family 9 protein [Pyrinomonadaceae bacterium]|nr:glycosyltransferase family 9 protein [Pyrinomonadaceae bacterium]
MTPLIPKGNLLILLFNGYGDCFLALPALREIRRRFTSNKIYMACFPDQANSLFQDLDFHFVAATGSNGQIRTEADLAELDFQQIVSFNAYFPCSVECELMERYEKLPRWGFCDMFGTPVDTVVGLSNSHMRDQYFQVLGWEPQYSEMDRRVFLPAKTVDAFEDVLKEWSSTLGERVYSLHLDSLPEKMWPVAKWLELVDYIWSRWGAWPILLGEEDDQALPVVQRFSYARRLPSQAGIALHFAAVKLTSAFIGIDSIFAHVSDSYEKPSVILFGPSDPVVWGPVSQLSRLVATKENKLLNELSPVEVEQEVDALFSLVF